MLNPKEIGYRIKQRREELGLTLEDIALYVKVARSTIQRYEAGSITRPKLPVLYSISQALQVSPDWLLGITDDPAPTTPIRVEKTAALPGDGLSSDELKLVGIYRSITGQGRQEMMAHAEYIGERYKKNPSASTGKVV